MLLPPCPQIRPLKVFDVFRYGIKKMWELYSCSSHNLRLLHAQHDRTGKHRTHIDMNTILVYNTQVKHV